MKHTLGILAHVDAGKTTLAERLLYHNNVIRKFGRVDEGSAYMDYSDIERERGITVFSDAARVVVGDNVITLIDTPGHADFSAETERAIFVMDYALLVISATDGVQSHTETLWNLLRFYKVPTFIFINKTDVSTADVNRTFMDIRKQLSDDVVDFNVDFSEEVAEKSEILLEEYIEGGKIENYEEIRKLVNQCKIFPCFKGSALKDYNIEFLLDNLCNLMLENTVCDKISAVCYKVKRVGNSRYCYLKINSGTIKVKDAVRTQHGLTKIDELHFPNGSKFISAPEATMGDICVVAGLDDVKAGEFLGDNAGSIKLLTTPVFSVGVIFDKRNSSKDIYEKMKIIEDEENTLSVRYNQLLNEINISVTGKITLQVIEYEFMRRFGISVSFNTPKILYKETILNPTLGYGHFEPLRHYAEVHIKINPAPRGSGISFRSECSTDVLKKDVQNLIRTHVFEKEHKGVLTGSVLTDVEYVLVTGRVHEKHTEGGDLREATYRAIRQALMKAENILLEPYLSFSVRCNISMSGRIMNDIKRMNGVFLNPDRDGEFVIINGRAPADLLTKYAEELITISGGRTHMLLNFDGYERCNEQARILEEYNYQPEHDIENTPDSVFCAKGAGFTVKWYEVEDYIHCK